MLAAQAAAMASEMQNALPTQPAAIGPVTGAGAGIDPLAAAGMATALRDAVARVLARPTGLVLLTGEGAAKIAALLASRSQAATHARIGDRASVGAAIDAAESGLVVATTCGAGAIDTMLALRRVAPDRFAYAATLRLVIAERRAPRLCRGCRRPEQAFGSMSALLGLDPGTILWTAEGCAVCSETGRGGTTGVFEGIEVDSAMRRLIYDGADAPLLARHAFLSAPNFASAARALAREGVIAPEDAVAVSRNDLALRESAR